MQAIFLTLSPIIIGYIFESRKYEYIWLFAGVYILLEILNRSVWSLQNYLVEINGGNLFIAANKFLLTTDPINHTFRSSGKIISKIEKSVASLKGFFFGIVDDFVPAITSLITVIITFLTFDRFLGLICLLFIVLITILNIIMAFWNGKSLKPILIQSEDSLAETYTEGLMSLNYIRSTFATPEFYKKIRKKQLSNSNTYATVNMGYGLSTSIVRILYGISFLIIGLFVLQLVNQNQLSLSLGVGIFVTYVSQIKVVRSVGGLTKNIVETDIRLKDFFEFIREFGKQSYPVL